MQIKDMFAKKIDREIQGVIIVGQGEEKNVSQEHAPPRPRPPSRLPSPRGGPTRQASARASASVQALV